MSHDKTVFLEKNRRYFGISSSPTTLRPHLLSPPPYPLCIPLKDISDKCNTIRDICTFLQPGFISPTSFKETLNLPNTNHIGTYKSIIELIRNDWIHLVKTKTSQQSLLKVFCFNHRSTKKKKINKSKISRNFQTKKFTLLYKIIMRIIINISWTNHIEGNLVLNPKTLGKIFLSGLKNFQMVIYYRSDTNLSISLYL